MTGGSHGGSGGKRYDHDHLVHMNDQMVGLAVTDLDSFLLMLQVLFCFTSFMLFGCLQNNNLSSSSFSDEASFTPSK